jgi:hypothetical protein
MMADETGDADKVTNLEERGLIYRMRVLIQHPSADLDIITRESGLTPNVANKRGEQRYTLAGTMLPGVYPASSWSYWQDTRHSRSFASGIASVLDRLTPSSSSIRDLRSTGGSAVLILELSGERNIGDVFDGRLLQRMVVMGLDFGIELYPDGI